MLRGVGRSLGHLVGLLKFCFLFLFALLLPRLFFESGHVSPTQKAAHAQVAMRTEPVHSNLRVTRKKQVEKNKLYRHFNQRTYNYCTGSSLPAPEADYRASADARKKFEAPADKKKLGIHA